MSLYAIEYRPIDSTHDLPSSDTNEARTTTIIDTEELGTEDAAWIEKQAIAIAPLGFLLYSMAKQA